MNIYPDAKSTKNQDGVLLVDFDPQGHLTAGCGLETFYTRSDFPLAAGRVLVPIQAEDTSIRGIEALEAEMRELKDILDADIEIVAIVPNMVTSNSVSERVLAELCEKRPVSEACWNAMAGVQIRKRVDLAKAWHEGKSIFSYNPRCDVIDSYRKLADFVCQVSR